MLKNLNIPNERKKQIKQERRTLKNRGYAANCRNKRDKTEKQLEDENDEIRKKIVSNGMEIEKALKETEELKSKYSELQKEARILREQHEQLVKAQNSQNSQDFRGLKELLASRTEIEWEKVNKQNLHHVNLG